VSNEPPPLDEPEDGCVSLFAGAGLDDRGSTVREDGVGMEAGVDVPVPEDSDCEVVVALS
jgi:hypothetical protein